MILYFFFLKISLKKKLFWLYIVRIFNKVHFLKYANFILQIFLRIYISMIINITVAEKNFKFNYEIKSIWMQEFFFYFKSLNIQETFYIFWFRSASQCENMKKKEHYSFKYVNLYIVSKKGCLFWKCSLFFSLNEKKS